MFTTSFLQCGFKTSNSRLAELRSFKNRETRSSHITKLNNKLYKFQVKVALGTLRSS